MKRFFQNKMNIKAVSFSVILVLAITLFQGVSVRAADYDAEYQINLNVSILGGDSYTVKTIHLNYPDNTYVSLRDMANALKGTKAQYNVSITKSGITMSTGESYKTAGGENQGFTSTTRERSAPEYTRKKNGFSIDGYNTHYYTMIYETEKNVYDCYMYLTDLALILGVDMYYENGSLIVNPDAELEMDPRKLEEDKFFECINGVLLGDATTGEIYYTYNGDVSAPMASTTKLMTYLLVMDAVARGELSLTEKTKFSAAVETLSNSPDHTIKLKEGSSATIEELLYAMLLPSSNECALALAEAVSGTEEKFVIRMNEKAKALGLSEGTVFYNCNGLPHFTEEVFEAKLQNRITPNDMFKLVCHIVSVYPQITEITSSTSKTLPSLNKTVYNTNSMLFNMIDGVGLKTGTTNKAGCCLVSAIETEVNGGKHIIVSVVLGAEDMVVRNSASKALLTYGRSVAKNGGASSIPGFESNGETAPAIIMEGVPETAEDLARLIVWKARNYTDYIEVDRIEIPEDAKGY